MIFAEWPGPPEATGPVEAAIAVVMPLLDFINSVVAHVSYYHICLIYSVLLNLHDITFPCTLASDTNIQFVYNV